jgi:hypothetical protein
MFICSHPIRNCNLNSLKEIIITHPMNQSLIKTKAFCFVIHVNERTHKEIETYNDFPPWQYQ